MRVHAIYIHGINTDSDTQCTMWLGSRGRVGQKQEEQSGSIEQHAIARYTSSWLLMDELLSPTITNAYLM